MYTNSALTDFFVFVTDTYLTGKMFKDILQVKFGKWYELNPYGWIMELDYRYEPALTLTEVTDWCGLNEKFLRFGYSYVPAKNIVLDTFYTWAKDIDTGNRNNLYRFQAYLFF